MRRGIALAIRVAAWLAASLPSAAQNSVGTTVVPAAPQTAASPERADQRLDQLRAEAHALEKQRAVVVARLERSMAEMMRAITALRAEEQRVAMGAAPRARLQPLQVRVARQQAAVKTTRTELAEITYRQSRQRSALKQGDLGYANRLRLAQQSLASRRVGNPSPAPVYLVRSQPTADGALSIDTISSLAARTAAEEHNANSDLAAANASLEAAVETRDRTKADYTHGVAPQSAVTTAEAELVRARSAAESARIRLDQRRQESERATRLAVLQRPIDVELREATIRQAAQSIAQAAGIPVQVEGGVPDDKRLTVVARGIPLATVLDSIARQSGLMIAPYNNGVSLKPMPSLEVNGQRTNFMLPFAPWSSEWGMNPAGVSGYTVLEALEAAGGYSNRFVVDAGSAPNPALTSVAPATGAAPDRTPASGPRVTVLGSVARPGVYPLQPGDRVSDLVSRVGGSTAGAARLALVRRDQAGLTLEWEVTVDEPLRSGDILSVQVPPAAVGRAPQTKGAPATAPQVGSSPAPGPSTYFARPGNIPVDAPMQPGRSVQEYGQPYYRFSTPGSGNDGYFTRGSATGPVSVTALSENSFVVANPAPGDEPGVLLTVYRLEGTQLRVVSSTVHRLRPASGGRGAANPSDYLIRPDQPYASPSAATTPKPQAR
jgi:hypothetical protein